MLWTIFNSTSLSASIRSVQRPCPPGTVPQHKATRCASLAPSRTGCREGRHCFFRSTAASKPSRTQLLRIFSIVTTLTPNASAIRPSVHAGPSRSASAFNSTWARIRFRAARILRPSNSDSCLRSSSLNRTIYRLDMAISVRGASGVSVRPCSRDRLNGLGPNIQN